MREIKFRVWDKELKRMRYDAFMISGFSSGDWVEFITERGNPYPVARFEIMQWTGFKDSDGNDIYEGDIIKIETTENEALEGIVVWGNGCFLLKWRLDTECYSLLGDFAQIISQKGKVIGNTMETAINW